ncbi:DUF6711 family protein [Ectobacillus ponti]|uniref:Uncharacterized protein n=1 Tax=Ectobacillus ponti TaxID=2961894 RepID=A0AA41XBB1_9BACI|nr:DUF6711 family protein [Ectobacillus ponti]MCP8969728.1 hypothetical protein [Ectobacillus ponti]
MALLTIGGVAMPTPSDLQVGIMDISNAQRNANGLMIIERIATKRKLSVSYNYASAADMQKILQAVAPVFYNVTFLNPLTNAYETSSFYCGDRSVGMIDYVNSVPRYKDLKFDLIER